MKDVRPDMASGRPSPSDNLPSGPPRQDRGLSFNRMIPNLLTLLALCAGMTAIRFALQERWEHAALALVAAAILDTLDGRVARLLKGASRFGAELDSLSDFISFGVAPAMMIYLWALQGTSRLAWLLALVFACCMALRLARFNTMLDDKSAPAWKSGFFTGTPAPAGAGLALFPMVLSFQIGDDVVRTPEVVTLFMIGTAYLMISRVPTFSFKRMKVQRHWVLPILVFFVVLVAASFSAPWLTLTAVLVSYMFSIPIAVMRHARLNRQWKAKHPDG